LVEDDDVDVDDSDSEDSAVIADKNNVRQQAILDIHSDECASLEEKKEIVYENLGFLENNASSDLDTGSASRESNADLAGGSFKGSENTGFNEHSNKRSRDDYDSDNNNDSTKKVKKN